MFIARSSNYTGDLNYMDNAQRNSYYLAQIRGSLFVIGVACFVNQGEFEALLEVMGY